jgi:CBS domain containing-hemolysin-like protein
VPETISITQVWNEMNQADSFMAIVFDEYGGTTGLITREDVIEELFGELQDEFDQEPALVRQLSDGRMVVRGDMSINTLNDLLNSNLPHENVVTVAGLIEDGLGRIPDVGDEITVEEIQFQVEAMAGNTITAVCVIVPGSIPSGERMDEVMNEEEEQSE